MQQALESPVRGMIVGISKESGKDFVLLPYLELSETVGEVILLMEASHEENPVKQRVRGGLRVVLVVVT